MLRQDPYRLEAAKYRVLDLLEQPGGRDRAMAYLTVAREHTPREDWADNIFAGIAWFALGEGEKAAECVALNIDLQVETELSTPLLAQIEAGKINPDVLLGRPASDRDILVPLPRLRKDENWDFMPWVIGTSVAFAGLGIALLILKKMTSGDPEEWYQMADAYRYGIRGVEQNLKKAVRLYRKAARRGHAEAQFSLGIAYERGRGVQKNLQKAQFWYQRATDQGHADARDALRRLIFR